MEEAVAQAVLKLQTFTQQIQKYLISKDILNMVLECLGMTEEQKMFEFLEEEFLFMYPPLTYQQVEKSKNPLVKAFFDCLDQELSLPRKVLNFTFLVSACNRTTCYSPKYEHCDCGRPLTRGYIESVRRKRKRKD